MNESACLPALRRWCWIIPRSDASFRATGSPSTAMVHAGVPLRGTATRKDASAHQAGVLVHMDFQSTYNNHSQSRQYIAKIPTTLISVLDGFMWMP